MLQRTQRQCRCGTADSRRTRQTTPYGSSHGTCAMAWSHQTGPSGTRSGGPGGWRPVRTRSTSSSPCYPGRGALPSCSRKQGSPGGGRRCTWPRCSRTRGKPPFSGAGWRRTGPPPPREGEVSSPRSAASTWQSTRCSVSPKSSPGRPRSGVSHARGRPHPHQRAQTAGRLLPMGGKGGVVGRHTNVCHGAQPQLETPGGHRRRQQHLHGCHHQPGHGALPSGRRGLRFRESHGRQRGGHDPHSPPVPAQFGHFPGQRAPPAVVPAGKRLPPRHGTAPGGRVGPPPGPPGPAMPPRRGRARGDAQPLQPHGGPPPPVRRRGCACPTLPVGSGHCRAE